MKSPSPVMWTVSTAFMSVVLWFDHGTPFHTTLAIFLGGNIVFSVQSWIDWFEGRRDDAP